MNKIYESEAAPRHPWSYYGLEDKEYRKKLKEMVRTAEYASLAHSAAQEANETIAEYILLSVVEKKPYELVEYAEGLGRIPCGRTNFYGYRRYFIYLFSEKLKKVMCKSYKKQHKKERNRRTLSDNRSF